MVDYNLDIGALIAANEAERIFVPVVACGVDNDAEKAAAAIRAGAKEFIPLPPEADLIAAVLAAVADDERPMISADPAMKAVTQLADQVARSEASILITGESGVGKEVMARYLHTHSKRAERPFISVNCAAIPDNLLESELFGHEKGAFTGAVARRIGKFEEADGGTLLLDEISEMDARLQAKLLRAIQERVIDRVGGTKPVPVNIRIIATSNRDLAKAVAEGTFREDLLYRLNVVNLRLPSLRERPGDIAVLADHFVKKYAAANGVPVRPLSVDARRALAAHRWPGNVRELENAMHRAVLLAVGPEIDVDAIRLPDGQPLSGAVGGSVDTGPAARAAQTADAVSRAYVGQTVAQMEKTLILDTLAHCLGNRTHAANILGISIRTLRNKLNEYADEGTQIIAPQTGIAGTGYSASAA
jgi:DNA-binding NtrC family response regulator